MTPTFAETTTRNNRSALSRIALFYLLAFAISWGIWLLLILNPAIDADWPLLFRIGAYGPFVAALITVRAYEGGPGLRRWLRSIFQWRRCLFWIVAAWMLLPLLIALMHLGLYLLLGNEVALSVDPPWYWAVGAYPLNVVIAPLVLGSSLGEEPGWQGFALPGLARIFGPLPAGILHGLLWATWHLPAFLTSWAGEEQPLVWFYAYVIPLSLIMFWLTQRARGSIVPAVLLHAATNLYGNLFLSETLFAGSLSLRFTELKTVVYWAVALGLLFATRGRLGYFRERG